MAQSELPKTPIEIVNLFFKGIVPEETGTHPGGLLHVGVKEVWNGLSALPHVETDETRDAWQKGSLRIATLAKQIALKCATLAKNKDLTLIASETLEDDLVENKQMRDRYHYHLLMPDVDDPGKLVVRKIRRNGVDEVSLTKTLSEHRIFDSFKVMVSQDGPSDEDQFKYVASFWPNPGSIIRTFTRTEGIYTPEGDRAKEVITTLESFIDPVFFQNKATPSA